MQEAALTKSQAALLERFAALGGCVDYVVLDTGSLGKTPDVATHRQGAIFGMEIIQKRFADSAARTSRQQNIPIDRLFELQIDYQRAERMEGRRVSAKELLGARYDHERKGLLLRGSTAPFLNSLIFYADPESAETVVASEDDAFGKGYSHAFSDPPYSLCDMSRRSRASRREVGELFESINREILGGITSASVIYEWPCDWSNYFEAGQDWWGTYFWTFSNPESSRIVVIAASTTD